MPSLSPFENGPTPSLKAREQEPTGRVKRPQTNVLPGKGINIALLMALLLGLMYFAGAPANPALAYNANPANIVTHTDGFSGRIDEIFPLPDVEVTPPGPEVTDAPVVVEPAVVAPEPAPVAEPPPAVVLPQKTGSKIEHVIMITIDGMRPDAMELANTPNLDKLRARGAYSPRAQTISLSITLPSHTSLVTGLTQQRHGIEWGLPYIGWPGLTCATAFSIAHDAGYSTGMIFGKEKLNYLALPNSVDVLFGVDAHDPEIRDEAIKMIEEGLPNLSWIHFPDTDRVGHAFGWMSENQLYAIGYADGLIGELVDALDREGYLDSTLLIITADHGGHGKGHGDDAPEDRTIPWLAFGPGVPQGVVLSSYINIFDTPATALHALNLDVPADWDGRPVLEIFETQQPMELVASN